MTILSCSLRNSFLDLLFKGHVPRVLPRSVEQSHQLSHKFRKLLVVSHIVPELLLVQLLLALGDSAAIVITNYLYYSSIQRQQSQLVPCCAGPWTIMESWRWQLYQPRGVGERAFTSSRGQCLLLPRFFRPMDRAFHCCLVSVSGFWNSPGLFQAS